MAKDKGEGSVGRLIDEVLKLRTLGADTRADLEELRDVFAKGELDAADAAYVASLHGRLKGSGTRPRSAEVPVPANDVKADADADDDDDGGEEIGGDDGEAPDDADVAPGVDWQAEAEHWRARAESLDAELADLRDRHEALRAELASLREGAEGRTDPNNPA
ncbi:MAG: hypothetical protein EA406_11655 [Rhodospirillales bacterium]|nr:MAG: hypothetical protein EA406_11655 [Rhodospirillales bacterium]